MYDGKVATTFFFSSSGGRTAASPTSSPARSRCRTSSRSPTRTTRVARTTTGGRSWSRRRPPAEQLGVPGAAGAAAGARDAAAPRYVVVTGRDGDVTVRGGDVRRALGLRSTGSRVGVLLAVAAGRRRRRRHAGRRSAGAAEQVEGRHARAARRRAAPGRPARRSTMRPDGIVLGRGHARRRRPVPAGGRHGEGRGLYGSSSASDQAARDRCSQPRGAGRARPAASALRPERPARRRSSGTWARSTRSTSGPTSAPTLAPVRVADRRLGHRSRPPGVRRAGSLRAQSFVGGDVTDRQGHGTFVAGIIAATPDNGAGDRRHRVPRPAADRQGRARGRDDLARRGGEGDPLGRRQRRARDQPQPRRPARPARPERGHVLRRRAGRDRVRLREGRGARRRGRERRRGAEDAVARTRATRPRSRTCSASARWPPDGSVPAFSNRDTVYNDIAAPGVGIVSTLPRALTAARPACLDQGYSICGPPEFRAGGRHVVRRGRGLGGGRAADRGAAVAGARPGDGAARALGRRRQRRHRLPALRRSAATRTAAGGGSTSPRR